MANEEFNKGLHAALAVIDAQIGRRMKGLSEDLPVLDDLRVYRAAIAKKVKPEGIPNSPPESTACIASDGDGAIERAQQASHGGFN